MIAIAVYNRSIPTNIQPLRGWGGGFAIAVYKTFNLYKHSTPTNIQLLQTFNPYGVGVDRDCGLQTFNPYKHSTPDGVGAGHRVAFYKHSTPDGLGRVIVLAFYKHSTPDGVGHCFVLKIEWPNEAAAKIPK